MHLEFLQGSYGIILYLTTRSVPFAPLLQEDSKSTVIMQIGTFEECLIVERLEGGQKLLLPEPLVEQIISALRAGTSIFFKTGRYQLTVSPDGFARAYALFDARL